ncbi:MAG: hypothetical protein ABI359_08935 [Ginsengibacter sp.]
MKTSFLIPFFILTCYSCTKKPDKAAFPNPGVSIHYVDQKENDLFGSGINGYVKENVRAYSMINEEKSIDSGIDLQKGNKIVYSPYKWGNAYNEDTGDSVFVATFILPVTKIDYKTEHYFTTLIDLKEGVEDTMRVFVNSRKAIDSLWYNRQLLYVNPYWPEVYDMRKIITIQKED